MYTREELEAAGLTDFRVFLRAVWEHLDLPRPTRVQYDIAWTLQHGERRMIVQGFRGVGKSWITVAFVLWNLLLDPEKKIMVVSASQQLADDFSKFCKQLIGSMEILQHLAAREGQRDSAISFDVGPASPSKDPSVKSVGITGQLTGSRADIIVPDDIEVPKNSMTATERLKLANRTKEFDAVLKPGGRVLYLGTPQTESSVYTEMYTERGYRVYIWPAEIPENPSRYAGRLAPLVQKMVDDGVPPGTPVDPKRFHRQDLDERRRVYGAAGYALQFMLDTSPSDADRHPLKLRDLIVATLDKEMSHVAWAWCNDRDRVLSHLRAGGLEGDLFYGPAFKSPEMLKWNGTVMAIDPSARGSDETAYAIVRYLAGQLFLVDSGGYKDGFGQGTLQGLADAAVRNRVNTVVIEENYGGGMFTALFTPVMHAAFAKANLGSAQVNPEDWDGWSRGQKEARICDVLQPIFDAHKLIVDENVLANDAKQQSDDYRYSLVYQTTRLTREKGALPHDDRVEALSMACAYWTALMNRDKAKVISKVKEDALNAMLRKYKQGVIDPSGRLGSQPKALKWARR